MPKAMQIWNHYRRMWMGAYYQREGIRVIPAPCWSDEESFEFCFDGMPKDSTIIISSVGCVQNRLVRARFNRGFDEALKRLTPSQIILYGCIDDDMRLRMDGIPYVHIESDMKRRIDKHKESLK
jgi:hypothetical protein